jgi:NADP-dependent 3-hydroxy acid dehydrogenase YdfG
MSRQLEGRVALVTGASSGIGEATALALATHGAKVAIAARREDRLQMLARRIESLRSEALVIAADITVEGDARSMIERTLARWDRLDILVNNAGVMLLEPVDTAPAENWRRMLNINLMGLMVVTQAALPAMRKQRDGHIVNISSTAGRVANPTAAVYAATKFGVGGFSEALRTEVFKDNIRVTVIEPGAVATELRDHITHAETKQTIETWANSMRQLQPEDVAASIVYAVTQPSHVNVNEILLRPTDQER